MSLVYLLISSITNLVLLYLLIKTEKEKEYLERHLKILELEEFSQENDENTLAYLELEANNSPLASRLLLEAKNILDNKR